MHFAASALPVLSCGMMEAPLTATPSLSPDDNIYSQQCGFCADVVHDPFARRGASQHTGRVMQRRSRRSMPLLLCIDQARLLLPGIRCSLSMCSTPHRTHGRSSLAMMPPQQYHQLITSRQYPPATPSCQSRTEHFIWCARRPVSTPGTCYSSACRLSPALLHNTRCLARGPLPSWLQACTPYTV